RGRHQRGVRHANAASGISVSGSHPAAPDVSIATLFFLPHLTSRHSADRIWLTLAKCTVIRLVSPGVVNVIIITFELETSHRAVLLSTAHSEVAERKWPTRQISLWRKGMRAHSVSRGCAAPSPRTERCI